MLKVMITANLEETYLLHFCKLLKVVSRLLLFKCLPFILCIGCTLMMLCPSCRVMLPGKVSMETAIYRDIINRAMFSGRLSMF